MIMHPICKVKFRFCGDGDCPEWVLAEINSTLSMMSAVKLKIITQTVVKTLLGDSIPEEKIRKSFANNERDNNAADAADPMKSAFACLRYLIVNAVRYGTDSATFGEELQQLGLPKEHSSALCRVCDEHKSELRALLEKNSLSVNQLVNFACTLPDESEAIDCATMHVRIANELIDGRPTATKHSLNISRADVAMLLDELRTIDRVMAEAEDI